MKIFRPKFNTTSLLLLVFFILCFLSILWHPSWQIGSDGFGYYSYLRSFIFDRDFNLANEFVLFDYLYNHNSILRWQTSVNQIANPFAVGSAILWAPFVLIAFIATKIFSFYDPYFIEGFNFPYQAAIAMGTWTYFLLGIAILFNIFRKVIGDKYAWLGIITTIGLSPTIFYLVYEPSMAHGLTVFSSSLFFYIVFKIYKTKQVYLKDYLFLGVGTALLFLIRWQDIIFAIIPGLIILRNIYVQKNYKRYSKVIIVAIASFILVISPQLFMWKYLFGSWFVVPQGASFFNLSNPHIWEFLVSSHHGLLAVNPLLFLAIIGLILFYRQDKILAGFLLLALISQMYINSALYDWYGGGSFGARRMLSSFFIFSLGFSFFIKSIFKKKRLLIIFGILVFTGIIFNALLMMSYARGIITLIDFTTYRELYLAPIKVLNSL